MWRFPLGFFSTFLALSLWFEAVESASANSETTTRWSSLLRLGAGGSCEDDEQWLEVKRRLHSLVRVLADGGSLDVPRAVNLLTKGVSHEDVPRCPVAGAAVQLFLQFALAVSDPQAAIAVLLVDPWPESKDEPWQDLSVAAWPDLLKSRWPFFGTLSLLRDVFRSTTAASSGSTKPGQVKNLLRSSCGQLWESLSKEQQADWGHMAEGFDCPDVHASVLETLSFSLGTVACAHARAAGTIGHVLVEVTVSMRQTGRWEELLRLAQLQVASVPNWLRELLLSPWPVLPLLAAVERRSISCSSSSGGITGAFDAKPQQGHDGLFKELRGVILYLHFNPNEMSRFHDIERSIASVEQYWLDLMPDQWPIFIFADPASAPRQEAVLRSRFTKLDLRLVQLHARDLSWPILHPHPTCSPGYRRAARMAAGPLYNHEALNSFTHVLLLDTEFEFTHPVPWDPLRRLHEQGAQLGYWQAHYEQTWNRTLYLTEVSREFMRARGLQPQIPELVQYWWDHEEGYGGSLPVNIYGCLFAGALSFFRSQLFKDYFSELDSWPGWDEHCWSPQSVLAIAAGFFLSDGELAELWVFGRHQNSSKSPKEGWNLSGKGVLPPQQYDQQLPLQQ